MADLIKFLIDDHARIRRSLNAYRRSPSLDAGLNVGDHLRMHSLIEAEFLQPLLARELGDREIALEAAAHGQLEALIGALEVLEPDDPGLYRVMTNLERYVKAHVQTEEQGMFPRLSPLGPQYEAGAAAFAMWQDLVQEEAPRHWRPVANLANTGWGGGGRFANSGW